MSTRTGAALGLAFISTLLIQLAYLREHDAAAALPALSMRRPLHSLRLLLTDRAWLLGFLMETAGFGFYVAALALASLALVQSVAAGGIGLLAYITARLSGRSLTRRELRGVAISVIGLLALAVSLSGGHEPDRPGSTAAILTWLGATAAAAGCVLLLQRRIGVAVADGVAAGLMFSLGDVSTKVATQGGVRFLFVLPLIAGYTLGTSLLQLGYQRGGALTVAGLATLLTNALPIAAGSVVLGEEPPPGLLGGVRIFAFATVTAGAILLARPQASARPSDERLESAAPPG